MKANLDLFDIIYGEFCSLDFYSTIYPLGNNPGEVEATLMSKFKCGSIEDYIKSLHHLLIHSCMIKLLNAYIQNVNSVLINTL